MLGGSALMLLWAFWRIRFGVDSGDGAHAVALAVRLAQGDVIFADEMNAQALGSLAAVPFTWLWIALVGTEGVVLASRAFYVLLALGAGVLAYRALRVTFPPLAAFGAAALMVVPTPYNLLVTSYNTMPGLALVVATTAGYAALARRHAGWGVLSGAALAVAGVSHPAALPGAAVLGLLLVLLGAGRARAGVLVGGLATSAVVLLGVLLGPGLSAVRATLDYTTAYQGERPHPSDRLLTALAGLGEAFVGAPHLPAVALAVLACVPAIPPPVRGLVAAGVAPAAGLAAWYAVSQDHLSTAAGVFSGLYAVVLALLLVLPVGLWAVRARRPRLLLLLLLALVPGLTGFAVFSATSSADVDWGVAVPPMLPLFGATGLGVLMMVGAGTPERARDRERTTARSVVVALTVLVLLVSLTVVHGQRSFRDRGTALTTVRVSDGPSAGLVTGPSTAARQCELGQTVRAWAAPGESVFFHRYPSGYLWAPGRMDTNILWLGTFGAANQTTLDWMERTGRFPDVVFVDDASIDAAGGWERLQATDPVVAELARRGGEPVEAAGFLVIRADGATQPPERPEPCSP